MTQPLIRLRELHITKLAALIEQLKLHLQVHPRRTAEADQPRVDRYVGELALGAGLLGRTTGIDGVPGDERPVIVEDRVLQLPILQTGAAQPDDMGGFAISSGMRTLGQFRALPGHTDGCLMVPGLPNHVRDEADPDIATVWPPDPAAACYTLGIMVGGASTRFKRGPDGVALGSACIYWNAGSRLFEQISRIWLSRFDAVESDGGECRLDFTDGTSLIVRSGIRRRRGAPDPQAAYDAFLRDLHERLGRADRPRIEFHYGYYPLPKSAIAILVGAAWITGVITAVNRDAAFAKAVVFGVIAAGIVALGLFFYQDNAVRRRYDTDALPKRALSGQRCSGSDRTATR